MGCHMVYSVMLSWQHHMPLLKKRHPPWQSKVCVRPLVNLIGECYEKGQKEEEAVPVVRGQDGLWRLGGKAPGHAGQHWNGHHEVVPIGLNEVMPRDWCWIDVMLSERTYKCLPNDRQLHTSPSVCSPVDKATKKIRCYYATHRSSCQETEWRTVVSRAAAMMVLQRDAWKYIVSWNRL